MAKSINDISDFQKDLLKQEIDIIDKTINRIDQIQQSMKNWTITLWGGSLYFVMQYFKESNSIVMLTAIIPLLFGYIDVVWKRQILKVSYRQKKISDFVSGLTSDIEFRILDPIAKSYSTLEDFKLQTSFSKAVWYKADGLFYLMMILVSLVLGVVLYFKMGVTKYFLLLLFVKVYSSKALSC
jgi:hypothetical protein